MMHRRFAVLAVLCAAALMWPAVPQAQNTAPLVRWHVDPETLCPGDSVRLKVEWCANCANLVRAERHPDEGLVIEVVKTSEDSCLSETCVYSSASVVLGQYQAGNHFMSGTLIEHWPGENDPRVTGFQIYFMVRTDCEPLPYVRQVLIHGQNGPRICENDSIRVTLIGELPSDCHSVRRVELFYPIYFRAGPPFVRVLVDDRACLGRPCTMQPVPWRREVMLPPLPVFNSIYSLTVEVFEVTCADTFPENPVAARHFPFEVFPPSACTPAPCLIPKWSGPGGPGCHARIVPGEPASLVMKVASGVPLAGLQGQLRFSHPGLRITGIEPVGAAAAWTVSWQARNDGSASFVMFSGDGRLIPAVRPWFGDSLGAPVLRVTVAARANELAPVTRLRAFELLGADSLGGAVRECMPPELAFYDIAARLCAERPCDANGDNISDVRDLVVMVRCLQDSACADSTGFDCDQDGDFTISDVLCCAMAILKRYSQPDPNAPRPDEDIGVTFDAPSALDDEVWVPVRVRGLRALGGALLRLRYPSDRYQLIGVEERNGPSVLALHSSEGDELALGFVNLIEAGAERLALPTEVNYVIKLALRPGAEAGGALELVEGQFSSPQGERLGVGVEPTAILFVPPVRATISAARPNPFARETRFSVDLPRAAKVDVTVHDLSGRRVAVLFRGELPAGRRDFIWSGAQERGGRAPDGVYFLRLAADGQTVSRKVVVLRQP